MHVPTDVETLETEVVLQVLLIEALTVAVNQL